MEGRYCHGNQLSVALTAVFLSLMAPGLKPWGNSWAAPAGGGAGPGRGIHRESERENEVQSYGLLTDSRLSSGGGPSVSLGGGGALSWGGGLS